MHHMWIVEVIPIKKGFPKDILTYFSAEPVSDGAIVSIPLRSKFIDGIVVGSKDAKEEKAAIKRGDFSLRKISKIKTESPLPDCLFQAVTLASRYYRRTRGEFLDIFIPDFSFYGALPEKMKRTTRSNDEVQPDRLLFQAPLEERTAYYRTYIRESFARKESITIICPTISDCHRFQEVLSKGISDFVYVLHSELTKKKRTDTIKALGEESHAIVLVCTPSYASLLRNDVGTIVLEHENSAAYTTPISPSYDFRVLMEMLARCAGIKYIAADSLLRVETLGRYENKEFGALTPITFRSFGSTEIKIIPHGIPEAVPLRMRSEQIPALSPEIHALIAHAMQTQSHIFAFALRTGLSTFTRCRDCGHVLACEYCTAPLVLYANSAERRVFICNKCKRHKPSESKCSRCGSWSLAALGTGTAFVEEEIKRLFPDLPVFRIDREVTTTRAQALKTAAAFAAAPTGILIGTEMALYYLSEDITHSIIVSFDTLYNIPSYRTTERIINLFLSISERTKGKLYVQTKHIDEPVIELIASNNYASWYREELAERMEYGYPPFTTIFKIVWKGKESEKEAARDYLADHFSLFTPDIFESISVTKGRREVAINVIVRPKRDEWSLYALLEGKELSEILREKLSHLPENTTFSINPDNLL